MSDQPTFTGNAEQQALAEQVFQIMKAQGAFFANDAPIRQTLGNLAEYFAGQRKADRATVTQELEVALNTNNTVFTREEQGEDVSYVISRLGAYRPRRDENTHMFKQRLYEPENPLPVDDISVVVTTTRPALTTVEPVYISDYWQQQAGLTPAIPGGIPAEPAIEVAAPAAVPVVEAAAPSAAAPAELETIPPAIEEQSAAPGTPAEQEPETVAVAPVAEKTSPALYNTMITLPNGVQIDLRRPTADLMAQYGPSLINQFRSALENDPLRRIVVFGNDAYPEAAVDNFGKNDLRRIRDYLLETGEPMADAQIIADIFYHNPRQTDYETFRFALDYRLSREKDFEFVGVDGARLWSTKGMPAIGTKRVKASEMGQLTGYLEEGFDDSLAEQSAEAIRKSGVLSHILTFFEWEYGMLPYTKAIAALLPSPLLTDQRTAVLRIESPQHYTSALAELRFPTGNRGGWLQGLEVFFHEHLIPGALITLSRTAEPHIFTLTYEEQPEQQDRLLVLDEKKNKLAFANVSYYAAVDEDMLVNQQQYGRLRNLKSLPMNERRKGDVTLEHVFETVGEPIGTRAEPRYRATTNQLFVGLNVLRPASREYLAHLLGDSDLFEQDGNTWTYTPPPAEIEDDEEDDDLGYDDDE
ncbi:MAG: hypothetical protein JST60_12455 [Chloroflexi bacterium SZAS-1]|nr:hypothetical protein [Chloroflexi bacterium SZAS-1]